MRRNGRAHSVAAGLGLGAVLAASLALTSGVVSGWAVEPIPIGFITPLTGSPALEGAFIAQGVDLAVAEINAAGGVLGRPVKVIVEDGRADPQESTSAAEKLIGTVIWYRVPFASFSSMGSAAAVVVAAASTPSRAR